MRVRHLSSAHLLAGAVVLAFALPARSMAVDFIRGDTNSDGVVTISDGYYLLAFIFRGKAPPECFTSGDADDDGNLGLKDVIEITSYVLGGPPPAAPFPVAGPDPTDHPDMPCATYGGGSPLEDPAAKLKIMDAVAAGGSDGTVQIRVEVSSSTPIAGYSGSFDAGVFKDVSHDFKDLTGTWENGFHRVLLSNELVRFGFLGSFTQDRRIEAAQNTPVLEITACLEQGTPAGEYPLTLEEGELVDAGSGRAIHPALQSGTLSVTASVGAAGDCSDVFPPPVNVVYQMKSVSADHDGIVSVPFSIQADAGVQAYAFSVDFDEEVLQATSVEEVWQKPDASEYGFHSYVINNDNANPGSAGVDEGYLEGAALFSFTEPVVMPPGVPNEALTFHFTVAPENTAPLTEVRFLDGAKIDGHPVSNLINANGRAYIPALATSFVFINSVVQVLPDGSLFIRGDSNGDKTVNITDAQWTLSYLFRGGEPPACFDATDANDDGRVDVSDPIATLQSLFLGGKALPPPNGTPAEDPTPDSLGCSYRS